MTTDSVGSSRDKKMLLLLEEFNRSDKAFAEAVEKGASDGELLRLLIDDHTAKYRILHEMIGHINAANAGTHRVVGMIIEWLKKFNQGYKDLVNED